MLSRALADVGNRFYVHVGWLALSGRCSDLVEPLRAAFAGWFAPERVRVFQLPGHVVELDLANFWRMQTPELLREDFVADVSSDIAHFSTLFEGLGNEVVASIDWLNATVPTAAALYDLISMLRSDLDFADPKRKLSPYSISKARRPAFGYLQIIAPGGSQHTAYKYLPIDAGKRAWPIFAHYSYIQYYYCIKS
jgi:hypothetical protein